MDFQSRTLKTPQKRRIIVEIDIISDEVDLVKCEKIADRLTNFICQEAWLVNPPEKFTFDSKVSVQSLPRKTYDQVQLPCATGNERVANVIAQRK